MLRLNGNEEENSFLIFCPKEKTLEAIAFNLGKFYCLKIRADDETIKKWAANVRSTPDEYICHLKEALSEQLRDSPNLSSNGDSDGPKNSAAVFKNSFVVSEGSLLWKQYFPEKGLYGRKGKFNVEEISHEEGIQKAFQMAFDKMISYQKSISNSEEEKSNLTKELSDTKKLANESVKMKAEFEKEIYAKFAAILNEKKKYIHQLRGKLTDSASNVSSVDKEFGPNSVLPPISNSQIREANAAPSRALHPRIQAASSAKAAGSSDEYDADTDQDEADTDDERERESAALKRRKEARSAFSDRELKKQKHVAWTSSSDGSQDLFNDSMEAELNLGYASASTSKRDKIS